MVWYNRVDQFKVNTIFFFYNAVPDSFWRGRAIGQKEANTNGVSQIISFVVIDMHVFDRFVVCTVFSLAVIAARRCVDRRSR